MNYSKVGYLIASLRKEKGLTQKELADKLRITDRAVSKWERGLGCPDVSLLDDLSIILDVSISEILRGRRLEKEEIVSNDSVIESMIYSRESLKHKMRRYFNIGAVSIIIALCLIISISILKSEYYLHKNYHSDAFAQSYKYLYEEVHKNIDIVKNNQGIYSGDDYKKILSFISVMESKLNKERDLNYYLKTSYTYPEIVNFYNTFCEDKLIDLREFNDTAYATIHKYNPSVVENMVHYFRRSDSVLENTLSLFVNLKNPYYNQQINDEIVVTIQSILNNEYSKDDMLLKDIIKVGEIHE